MSDAGKLQRYSRQIVLPGVGVDGQQALREARVAVVGLGGLGCPAALYLASAGVGAFWLADYDRVDESNLQRQILYTEADIGRRKVEAARDRLLALDSVLDIAVHSERLEPAALEQTLRACDLVIDGSDNFATRHAVNRAALGARCGLVVAAAIRQEGQVAAFAPGRGESPCYACLFGAPAGEGGFEEAERCEDAGILAPVVGVIGSLAAQQALQLLLGSRAPVGWMTAFDATGGDFRRYRVPRDPACSVCGAH